MRKLIVAAVGLMTWLTALPLYAVDVNFSGEFRVRGFWADNLTDGDSGGAGNEDAARFNDQRFRLKTTLKAGVTTGVVVLDFGNCFVGVDVATFSSPGSVAAGSGTGDCRFGTAGLGRSFNVVGVREANLHIDLAAVDFVLGRQTIKLGHGIILDDTADAITVVLPMGSTTVTGSLLQLADATDSLGAATSVHKDTSIWLLNVGMDHGNHVINLYDALVYDQAGTILGPAAHNYVYPTGVAATFAIGGTDKLWLNIVGISVDATNGPMKLALEGSYAYGRASSILAGTDARLVGWNVMGDATVDAGGAKVGGTVVYADSTQDQGINSITAADISGNFQLGNILLNNEMTSDRDGGSLAGGFGGQGLAAVKLHVDAMPTEKLSVGGAAIYAQNTQTCTVAFGYCASSSRVLGIELDANASYAIDDNLSISAGAGYLFTGDAVEDFYSTFAGTAGDNNLWKLSGKVVFTF